MKSLAKATLLAILLSTPIAAIAQTAPAGNSGLAQNVQNLLPRYGFNDVDASTLTNNQLAGIFTAFSSQEYSRTEKVRRVNTILRNG